MRYTSFEVQKLYIHPCNDGSFLWTIYHETDSLGAVKNYPLKTGSCKTVEELITILTKEVPSLLVPTCNESKF